MSFGMFGLVVVSVLLLPAVVCGLMAWRATMVRDGGLLCTTWCERGAMAIVVGFVGVVVLLNGWIYL